MPMTQAEISEFKTKLDMEGLRRMVDAANQKDAWEIRKCVACAIVIVASMLTCGALIAQEPPAPPPKPTPKIEGPSLASPGQELRLSVTGLTTPPLSEGIGKLQEWSTKVNLLVDSPDGGEAVADTDLSLGLGAQSVRFRVFFTPTRGGVYFLVLHDANADQVVTKRITVGPVEPPPPNPPPGPHDPPAPPIPLSGLRVLILEETGDRQKLPSSQAAILTSTEVRAVLNTKCAKGPGGLPEFRLFDADADLSLQEKHWQDAAKLKRDSLPWLVISDGKQGYQGPLPPTIPDMLALIAKFGG